MQMWVSLGLSGVCRPNLIMFDLSIFIFSFCGKDKLDLENVMVCSYQFFKWCHVFTRISNFATALWKWFWIGSSGSYCHLFFLSCSCQMLHLVLPAGGIIRLWLPSWEHLILLLILDEISSWSATFCKTRCDITKKWGLCLFSLMENGNMFGKSKHGQI